MNVLIYLYSFFIYCIQNLQVYQYFSKSPRVVFQIALSSDDRYTPAEGRYHHRDTPSIETTYLYPQIHGRLSDASPSKTAYPTYRQLQLHNSQLNQVKFQAKKKSKIFSYTLHKFWPHETLTLHHNDFLAQYLDITPSLNKGHSNSFRTQSYQNFNIINTPIAPPTSAAAVAARGSGSKVDYYVPDVSSHAHVSYY